MLFEKNYGALVVQNVISDLLWAKEVQVNQNGYN